MDNDGRIAMQWRLRGDREADWSIVAGTRRVDVAMTYAIDSFSALVRSAVDVKVGTSATYVPMAGEPAGSLLFVSRFGDELDLRLVSFSAMSAGMARFIDGKLRWSQSVSREAYVEAVLVMVSNVLREYGEQEFARRWGHSFPWDPVNEVRDA
jgi:hypothetical protein